MQITVRYKNEKGKTVGYKLKDKNNNEEYVSADVAVKMSDCIGNARLLSNGEFKANPGCHIDTLLYKKALRVHKRKTEILTKSNGGLDIAMKSVRGAEFINRCKEIRKCAINGNIEIDYRQHKSNRGLDKHLLRLIKARDINIENFIRGYLSVLQPCFLEEFKGKTQKDVNCIWVCDPCYKVKMLLKIHKEGNGYIVVSFHESNIGGKGVAGRHFNDNDNCIVFTDKVSEVGESVFRIEFPVQRGFLRQTIKCGCSFHKKGIAIVKYYDIRIEFETLMEGIIRNTMEIYNEGNNISIGNRGGVLSFISYGATVVNQVYMLIDVYGRCTDARERGIIVSVASQLVNEMSEFRQAELKEALKSKFENSLIEYRNELYKYIIGGI